MPAHKRFLIVSPYGIGDVLFSIPMMKNIKANVPDAFIGYMVNRRTAPLLQNVPEINQVVVYDRDEFKAVSDQSKIRFLRLIRDTIHEIRDRHYDIAIDLSMTGYASFYSKLAGIKERMGFNYKNRSPFLTKKIPFVSFEGRHVAEYYLDILRTLGMTVQKFSMEIPVAVNDQQWAQEFLKNAKVQRPLVAIFPGGGESWGAEARFKRWSTAKYAQLIQRITEVFNLQVILLGNSREESLCKEIQSLVKYPLLSACGMTTLGQTMAILKNSELAVVNDGGPLHMAVAAGTRTVSIFGPVDEKVYGPYPAKGHAIVTQDIACRPCYRNFRRAACEHISCLGLIQVEDVFREVEKIFTLSAKGGSASGGHASLPTGR